MKGKITIVLFSVALVFGLFAASCVNGDLPDTNEKDYTTLFAYENAGDNLPTTDIDTAPKPLTGKALWNKLYGPTTATNANNRTEFPAKSGKYVQTWVLGTVSTTPPKGVTYNATQQAIAAKYAGLPIPVRNSILP